jgi:photosystem II stability/assembly factor-like uncharacterized protein
MIKNWTRSRVLALTLAATVLPSFGIPLSPVDPLNRPALQIKRPTESALMDVARAGSRLIAVGEHGIVLLSDDDGQRWRQVPVPVSVTLTGVSFATNSNVWAVGHSGVVLNSENGGETWTRRLDGIQVAKLAVETARAEGGTEAMTKRRLLTAQQLEIDGPDKPFFGIHFDDPQRGFIVGAYGLILYTTNGGKSWLPWMNHVDNPKSLTIYAIRRIKGVHYLAGEQGLFCRTHNESVEFECVTTPFEGSYFALSAGPRDEVIVAGLLGNAFATTDKGDHWQKLKFGNGSSLAAISILGDKRVVFGSQRGELFGGYELADLQPLPIVSKPVTSLIETSNGSLVIVGPLGLQIIPTLETKREPAKAPQ